MTVFSPGNEMSISLLLYPDRAPSRWEMAELEEEPTLDTFDKFMGDAIMALFGAPEALEDDIEAALRCAIEMQQAMQEDAAVFRTGDTLVSGVNRLGLAVAVASGDVEELAA